MKPRRKDKKAKQKAKKKIDIERIKLTVSLLVTGFMRDNDYAIVDDINVLIQTFMDDLVSFDSNILSDADINRLINLLLKKRQFGGLKRLKIETKYKLLYRASRDGWDNMHKYCDNKENTLMIAMNDYGHIFGQYLSQPFDQENNETIIDCYSFVLFIRNDLIKNAKDKARWISNIGDRFVGSMPYPYIANNIKTSKFHEYMFEGEEKKKSRDPNGLPKSIKVTKYTVMDYEIFQLRQKKHS